MAIIHDLPDVRPGIRWFACILSFNLYNITTKLIFYKKIPLDTERSSDFFKSAAEQS